MKPKKKSVFSTKVLTQAVAVGLLMLSTEAVASSGAANAGVARSSFQTGTTNTTTTNLDKTINHFQTIGDLEIYQAAQDRSVTMMMMLDISGSMWGCLDSDFGPPGNQTRYKVENYKLTDKAGTPVKTIKGDDGKDLDISAGLNVVNAFCKNGAERNRISALKHAVLSVIGDGTKLPDNFKIGIGTFPARGNTIGTAIAIPIKSLTPEHRYRIMRTVASFNPIGSTPSAQAIAEAGAYMLGTTTVKFANNATKREFYMPHGKILKDGNVWRYRACTGYFTESQNYISITQIHSRRDPIGLNWVDCETNGDFTAPPNFTDYGANGWTDGATPFGTSGSNIGALDFGYFGSFGYMLNRATNTTTPMKDNKNPGGTFPTDNRDVFLGEKLEFIQEATGESNEYTGFSLSSPDTKKSDLRSYDSPLINSEGGQSCDGYGFYFLTDGEPNNAHYHHLPMGRSLGYNLSNRDAVAAKMTTEAAKSGHKNDIVDNGRIFETMRRSEAVAKGLSYTELNPRNETWVAVQDRNRGTAFSNSGWKSIGEYAAILSNKDTNPLGIEIQTATVGFGPVFSSEEPTTKPEKYYNPKNEKYFDVVDCSKYTKLDSRNLCYLGERGYNYGNGGFTATSKAEVVAQSIIDFAGNLTQAISNQPAGTISVPKDPLSITNIQPYAYLPMIAPQVVEPDALWAGNLKKYHTLNGTLYGRDGRTRLYERSPNATTENRNYPSQFNPNIQDIWQTSKESGARINVGGTYGTIKSIKTDSSFTSRTLWLENYKNFRDNVPATYAQKEIVEVGIKNGKLTGFSNLKDPYNITDKVYIVNYLGVNVPVDDDSIESDEDLQAAVDVAIRNKSFHDTLLGGVLHSVPVLATYRGEFEAETGAISSDENVRQDHLLYGSMDGALHLVEAKTGRENFAFVPRAMFEDTQQRHAMLKGSQLDQLGQPKFGVDAPWVTHAEYVYDFGKKPAEVRAKTMYAFGGLRMGGSGIYGLNITNRDKPELNFAITRYNDQFRRLGQIWAKPTVAKIKTGPKPRDVKDVVIFGGGYDMCYEHPLFELGASESVVSFNATHLHREQVPDNTITTKDGTGADIRTTSCANKTQAMGNAVYMVDAKNGTLIARWQAGEGSDDRRHMLHSVVGEITTLDSNNNGAIDHLYFADLGGQVFRVDLKEQASGTAITRRVVRVLDANGHSDKSANHINYRFYDKPLVTFYDHGGKSFAVVNVASGDRSSPVHTHRTSENSNRIYGFFDRDLTTNKLDRANLDMSKLLSRNITSNQLEKINTKDVETQGATKVNDVFGKLQAGVLNTNPADNGSVRQGWYYDMNRFDGRINVSGLKSMGLGTVMGNVYYANIYSPSYEYTKAQDCSARVSGGTERQLYCLPWGICADSKNGNRPTTANGVLGYLKAGPGIQELAIGTITNTADKSGNFRAILGHQSLKEIAETNRTQRERPPGGDQSSALSRLPNATKDKVDGGEGSGGDVYGPNVLIQPRYTLAVQRWYDLQNENQSN